MYVTLRKGRLFGGTETQNISTLLFCGRLKNTFIAEVWNISFLFSKCLHLGRCKLVLIMYFPTKHLLLIQNTRWQ